MHRPRLSLALALLVGVSAIIAGCDSGSASASFDPSTPCAGAAQQIMPGAYPDLEARIPATLQGQTPGERVSGRFCAQATLGSLWDAGIHEEQFGGATWALGDKAGGVQLTVFRAAGLSVQAIADEYRGGAAKDSTVTIVTAATLTVAGRNGYRLDLLNGESRQAIVIWPSADAAVVQVVVAADVDETTVQAGIKALG